MALEADCGSAAVLEALCVASTSRSPVPEGCRATCAALATRPSATAPRRLWIPGRGFRLRDGKSEIRNPKFEMFPTPSMRE